MAGNGKPLGAGLEAERTGGSATGREKSDRRRRKEINALHSMPFERSVTQRHPQPQHRRRRFEN
jgi:hypothetical protein